MAGFRKFLLRGNLVELAVAVVVGVAFNEVVQALIRDLITPLIGALGARRNFAGLAFTVHGSAFAYGDFINAALSFVIIATVVYYFVVAPTNRLATIATRNTAAAERVCPECLSNIPAAATRCMYCTAVVVPVTNGHPGQPAHGGVRGPRPAARRHRATQRAGQPNGGAGA
jgi:large conductance mechanosensitive channel